MMLFSAGVALCFGMEWLAGMFLMFSALGQAFR